LAACTLAHGAIDVSVVTVTAFERHDLKSLPRTPLLLDSPSILLRQGLAWLVGRFSVLRRARARCCGRWLACG
jgi:hypothetical protein